MYDKIVEYMRSKNFTLHSHNAIETYFLFYECDETIMPTTGIHCVVTVEYNKEVFFEFKYTTKSMLIISTNKLSPLFNEVHFKKWHDKMINIVFHLQGHNV